MVRSSTSTDSHGRGRSAALKRPSTSTISHGSDKFSTSVRPHIFSPRQPVANQADPGDVVSSGQLQSSEENSHHKLGLGHFLLDQSPSVELSNSASSSVDGAHSQLARNTVSQQPAKMMNCEFVTNPRFNASMLLKDANHYTYKKRSPSGANTFYYECTERTEFACRATAIYHPQNVGYMRRGRHPHTHEPNPQKLLAQLTERNTIEHLVESCPTQQLRPSNMMASVIRQVEKTGSRESLGYVSSKEALRSKTTRYKRKRKLIVPEKSPTAWPDIIPANIPDKFKRLPNGSLFIRYHGPVVPGGTQQMIVCASDAAIQILRTAQVLSGDGTFSSCPGPFDQLFVIIAEVTETVNLPCVFALLPDRKAETYLKLFSVVASFHDELFKGRVFSSIIAVYLSNFLPVFAKPYLNFIQRPKKTFDNVDN